MLLLISDGNDTQTNAAGVLPPPPSEIGALLLPVLSILFLLYRDRVVQTAWMLESWLRLSGVRGVVSAAVVVALAITIVHGPEPDPYLLLKERRRSWWQGPTG